MSEICADPRGCCGELTRVWDALGITTYTGRSASEHVRELREKTEANHARVQSSDERPAMGSATPDHLSSSSVDATARLIEQAPKECVIGKYCRSHGFIHGGEAEELRERIENLINSTRGSGHLRNDIRELLDDVDARDSCAFVESVDAVQVPHETRFAWLMERRLTIDSGGMRAVPAGTLVYWDGGHAESFTTDANDAVQWCRRQDVLACTRFTQNYAQWGWQIVEHGFTGEAQVDAVRVRVHQIEQERDELRKRCNLAEGKAALAMAFGRQSEQGEELADALTEKVQRQLSEAEARVSHLEQELEKATKGQWTQAESDAVKWRAQERSDTWLRARDLQSHGDGLDLGENLNGKAADDE